MKKVAVLLFLITIITIKSFGQRSLVEWESFIQTNKPTSYISYNFSKGKANIHSVACYVYNDSCYIIERKNRILQRAEPMSTEAFNLLYENLSTVIFLKDRLNSSATRDSRKYSRDQRNAAIEFKQVGIRYGNLHFNHFRLKTEDEINQLKNKKLIQAYKVLNELVKILHQNIN